MITKIEIVIAHFHGSRFIEEQIASIQSSHLPAGVEIQILIQDDFSVTEEFVRLTEVCARWPNVKIHRNESNLGAVRTFERALQRTQAPYVMLCDQDDVWLPDKVAWTLQKMKEVEFQSPALVFTELTIVNSNLEIISERMLNKAGYDPATDRNAMLFQNVVTGCTIMVNRKLLDFALPFPNNIPMHDHWLAVCAAFAGKIGYVDEPTILYRQHSSNLVGRPNRRLYNRARNPFRTRNQFNKELVKKGLQATELSERLPQSAEKILTSEIGNAFLRRSFFNLRLLVRARVIVAGPVSFFLISLLYLLIPKKDESNAAQ